ncbi:Serine protease inhibitor 88Ea [Gryllus bimaculatus]|nr:Serine protease inhibitor 88Ea [Gryllus bimaculatus]
MALRGVHEGPDPRRRAARKRGREGVVGRKGVEEDGDRDGEEEEDDGEQAAHKPSDAPEREGLRTANRVFVAENVTLRECVKELLGADQESLAVAADPEAAAARVNAWVSEQTAGHIKQLVPALRPDAQLVLVNAAFFRGAWASRFPRNRSALAVFHSAPDRRALGRGAEGGAGGVELGVDALLRRLDAPALAELLRDLDGAAQTVEVHVPRLALDADIDLVPARSRGPVSTGAKHGALWAPAGAFHIALLPAAALTSRLVSRSSAPRPAAPPAPRLFDAPGAGSRGGRGFHRQASLRRVICAFRRGVVGGWHVTNRQHDKAAINEMEICYSSSLVAVNGTGYFQYPFAQKDVV